VSVSAIVPEKSRGNKKCDDEEEEERHIFGLLASLSNGRDMIVCNSMFVLSRTAR